MRRKRAIGVETRFTGEKRLVGLELADARAELGPLGDVGWIAEDEDEAFANPFGPVADLELQATIEPEAFL